MSKFRAIILSIVFQAGLLQAKESGTTARGPTKRVLDAGDSARFISVFLASSFSCSPAESTPTPAPVTQTVSHPLAFLCTFPIQNQENTAY